MTNNERTQILKAVQQEAIRRGYRLDISEKDVKLTRPDGTVAITGSKNDHIRP